MIRGPVRPALQGQQDPVRQLRAAGETRLEELGAQVVMVEHEAGAIERAEGQGQRPEDVGRVAGLDHREAAGPPALSVSHAVARNEYAYSAMKLTLLPPGA